MPTKVVLDTVVNRWKDRYVPQIKGQMKPMIKATRVGSTNTGQYLLMAFCMIYLLMELLEKRREAGELIARLPH